MRVDSNTAGHHSMSETISKTLFLIEKSLE